MYESRLDELVARYSRQEHGHERYHETITIAYVRLIDQFLAGGVQDDAVDARLAELNQRAVSRSSRPAPLLVARCAHVVFRARHVDAARPLPADAADRIARVDYSSSAMIARDRMDQMTAFEKAFGYQGDNMNLPVRDLDEALPFYQKAFGFSLLSRSDTPHKSAVLGRDQVRIGLAENGGDPTQDGCAFHVKGLESLAVELKANGLQQELSNFSTEQHGGASWTVFYVVAPDGLCYWLGERQENTAG